MPRRSNQSAARQCFTKPRRLFLLASRDAEIAFRSSREIAMNPLTEIAIRGNQFSTLNPAT
jgi:hypothetical protein